MSLARSQKGDRINQKIYLIYITVSYAASHCFTYPDPSYYGLNALRPKSYPYKSTAFSSPNPPTAPVLTAFAPPLAVNSSQIALSRPAAVYTPASAISLLHKYRTAGGPTDHRRAMREQILATRLKASKQSLAYFTGKTDDNKRSILTQLQQICDLRAVWSHCLLV